MLLAQTLEKLTQMKLYGIVKGLETYDKDGQPSDLSFSDRLTLLVDQEWTHRENKKIKRLLQGGQFKEKHACLEALDYRASRGLRKSVILELAENDWIKKHQNIIITGPAGAGKSFLAQALGNHAARHGFSVSYLRMPKVLFSLVTARADGSYLTYLKKLMKTQVVILDDWGVSTIGEQERQDLLEVIEDRHKVGSTILTSQLPVAAWHQYLGGGIVAESILDRLLHSIHRFELDSKDSLRKDDKLSSEILTQDGQSGK
jgi:DNA replication protein DnaC